MKLGIVGSRRRNSPEDKRLIRERILELRPEMIISGGCPKGADKFAEELAKELGIAIAIFYPKQETKLLQNYYGRVEAFYKRNEQIAMHSEALLALVASDRKGGTENTIKYFKKCKPSTWENCLEIL